jgi:hypothetical protein
VLIFSGNPPPQKDIDRVAHAFWQILLKDPQDLPEYTDHYYYTGAGVEVRFGVRDGEPFMKEVRE